MKKKFNALIVGFGYWGPILARNFQNSSQFEVYAVCDSNNPNLNRGKNIYPNKRKSKSKVLKDLERLRKYLLHALKNNSFPSQPIIIKNKEIVKNVKM